MGQGQSGMDPSGRGNQQGDKNNKVWSFLMIKDKEEEKKKYEPPPPPARIKRKKKRGAEASSRIPKGILIH